MFQSTPPRGRRPAPRWGQGREHAFQSTPPRGRRLHLEVQAVGVPPFQSTPPRGRRPTGATTVGDIIGFNPRLRGGGDHQPDQVHDGRGVSIHASEGEATSVGVLDDSSKMFQSTPPRGRRPRMPGRNTGIGCFNPRLRGGGDHQPDQVHDGRGVSIHASEGEATIPLPPIWGYIKFQSTPPRGRRLSGNMAATPAHRFNPRLRGGGDQPAPQTTSAATCFNPRLRGGGDILILGFQPCSHSFNPRLRGGGDTDGTPESAQYQCFNPRLRGGGDLRVEEEKGEYRAFQSTPPRGRRLQENLDYINRSMFQSTPPRGRRRRGVPGRGRAIGFNPRLRGGGDLPCFVH